MPTKLCTRILPIACAEEVRENLKLKHVILISGIMAVILVSVLLIAIYQKPSIPSVDLVSYEWDVRVIDWEHEYVEVNITLLNSGNSSAEFTLEIDLYDDEQYFESQLWKIELPANHEETFTKTVLYELLVNKHHANAIEIICGIYGDDDCLEGLCFREFSSKAEA